MMFQEGQPENGRITVSGQDGEETRWHVLRIDSLGNFIIVSNFGYLYRKLVVVMVAAVGPGLGTQIMNGY